MVGPTAASNDLPHALEVVDVQLPQPPQVRRRDGEEAECNDFVDCPDNQQCLVSGTSGTGRGTADTRSFCGTVR
jgi:hypothetical protein